MWSDAHEATSGFQPDCYMGSNHEKRQPSLYLISRCRMLSLMSVTVSRL